MRLYLVGARWCVLVGLLTPLAACSRERQKASATSAADTIWKEYAASLNEGDLERWLALWTEDGVQMPPDEAAIFGKDNIRTRNEAMLERFTFDIGITNQEIETSGDLAYSRGIYKAQLMPKDGGRPISIDGKYLTVLERQTDGSWKIHRDIFNSNRSPQSSK
jgi:uncharacterized protein (TIGR02246 family)